MSSGVIANIPKNMKVMQYNLINKSTIINQITLSSIRPSHIYTNGYIVKILMAFKFNTSIASFTPLVTLTDSALIPYNSINFYSVEQCNSSLSMQQWQVLDTGVIRSSNSYNANDNVLIELNYPLNV